MFWLNNSIEIMIQLVRQQERERIFMPSCVVCTSLSQHYPSVDVEKCDKTLCARLGRWTVKKHAQYQRFCFCFLDFFVFFFISAGLSKSHYTAVTEHSCLMLFRCGWGCSNAASYDCITKIIIFRPRICTVLYVRIDWTKHLWMKFSN